MIPFRIIFCGTPDFAVPSLRALAGDARFQIVAVVTQPDKAHGRSKELQPPPVKTVALEFNLPVLQPEKLQVSDLNGLEHDFLVAVAYGQILNDPVLALPMIAPVNLHASLLPRWRGASPIHHAILAGDAETGVTVQRMVKALDAGPILSQARMELTPAITTPELSEALAALGAELLCATLSAPLVETEQDATQATVCGKLRKEDGAVHPSTMTAVEIDRRIRALTPWPGVTCMVEGTVLKLLRASLEPQLQALPLPCAENTLLYLTHVQQAGGKPMSGAEWARGHGAL